MSTPLERLQHHVTGAIERGEKEAIVATVPVISTKTYGQGYRLPWARWYFSLDDLRVGHLDVSIDEALRPDLNALGIAAADLRLGTNRNGLFVEARALPAGIEEKLKALGFRVSRAV